MLRLGIKMNLRYSASFVHYLNNNTQLCFRGCISTYRLPGIRTLSYLQCICPYKSLHTSFTSKYHRCRNSTSSFLWTSPADHSVTPDTTVHGIHNSAYCNSQHPPDVPDYLVGSITDFDCPETEEDMEEADNELEEEIIEFLTCRALPFVETDGSITIACPTCSSSKNVKQMRDIFIDKNSGYYVCPWCCSDGTWEELCTLLDTHQDSLTPEQLTAVMDTTLPLHEDLVSPLLNNSHYRAVSVATLLRYGCRMTADGGRVFVPVYREERMVGFYSVPLLHPDDSNKVVARYLEGQASVWSSITRTTPPPDDSSIAASSAAVTQATNTIADNDAATSSRVVVVSHICEALYLAQCGVQAVTIPAGVDWDLTLQHALSNDTSGKCGAAVSGVWGLVPEVRHVSLWLTRTITLPYRFFAHLNKDGIACAAVSPPGIVPLYQLTKTQVTKFLQARLLPLLSDKVVPFDTLQEEIFHRITHKQEVYGVPWRRFTGVQNILLGHRAGEVTVVSGPTGAGKTTLMSEYSLDLATQGVVTLWVSLEVSVVRLCEVLLQQCSGAPLPHQRHLFAPLSHHFKQLPIYFLDFHGQQDLQYIMQVLRESVVMRGVRHVVVDNLQFLVGCQDTATERWQQQDRAMAAFRSFATQQQCHVTLIVHPKKLMPGELLTLQSIGGGARVTQEADNVLLLQVTEGSTPAAARKAIQIVKNRYGGHLGVVPIKFHKESLTFSGWFNNTKDNKKNKLTKNSKSIRELSNQDDLS